MNASDPRLTQPTPEREKLEGDGQDAYPTFRDGSAASPGTSHKPTDVDLPQSQRTYGSPMLIGLIAFAVVIIVSIVWGAMNLASNDAPPDTIDNAPASQGAPADGTTAPSLQGEGADTPAEAGTGPGVDDPAPGAADVPGGATTTPAPAPTNP